MSVPPASPAPTSARQVAVRPARPKRERFRLGWIEIVTVGQLVFMALLFIPAMAKVRILVRVGGYGLALIAWLCVTLSGRPAVGRRFPAYGWLVFCSGWLILSIFHPETNSLLSGTAEAALVISIFSPAFWVQRTRVTPLRIERLMVMLLVCNGLSVLLGIAQFYNPDRFNPPVLPTTEEKLGRMMYTTADGREVLRPCGLTDSPGGAAGSGLMTCLLGLSFAMRPIALWKRLGCLALALAGMAVIYLCQIRQILVVLLICVLALEALFMLQRDYRRVLILGTQMAIVSVGAVLWVLRSGGMVIFKRFLLLVSDDPLSVYQSNRGFLFESTTFFLENHPLGAGLGRWGTVYAYFGNHALGFTDSGGNMWAEIQWTVWVLEGGFVMLVAYPGAIAVAMYTIARIARTCTDRTLAYWAAVVCALCLSMLASTFSYVIFVSTMGLQFWTMLMAVFAADQWVRAERRRTLLATAKAASVGR